MKQSRYAAAPATQKQTRAHSPILANGRPRSAHYGVIPPHILKIEGYVEALVALEEDAELLERSHRAHSILKRAYNTNRARYQAGQINGAEFERIAHRLEASERRLLNIIADRCRKRSEHLRARTIPEVKRCAGIACAA